MQQNQNLILSKKATTVVKKQSKQEKLTRLYLGLIRRNERDVLSLLQRVEEDLEKEEVISLWIDSQNSPLFKVRVYLL